MASPQDLDTAPLHPSTGRPFIFLFVQPGISFEFDSF